MTTRLTFEPPLPPADSWAGRHARYVRMIKLKPEVLKAKRAAAEEFCDMTLAADDLKAFAESMDAAQEAIFSANMANRDQDAADYGDPEYPREFYAGRGGMKAEKIVLDCLRALRAIPEPDRLYVDELTDVISRGFLDTSPDGRTEVRRSAALLRASREEKACS